MKRPPQPPQLKDPFPKKPGDIRREIKYWPTYLMNGHAKPGSDDWNCVQERIKHLERLAAWANETKYKRAIQWLQERSLFVGLALLILAATAILPFVPHTSLETILTKNLGRIVGVQEGLDARQANGRFTLYVHLGASKGRPVPDHDSIKRTLAAQGYTVFIDEQSDASGPRVDYTYDEDKQGAESVAKLLAGLLPGKPINIPTKPQVNQNPRGTLGIWF